MRLSFAWLEITGKCQLECGHCYADSGPNGSRGVMTDRDWESALDQLADLGTRMIQFIGGSHYSDNAIQHALITRRHASHARTRSNIVEAIRRSIPLRVDVVEVEGGQRVEQAVVELGLLGVAGEVRVDRLRQVGRGARNQRPDLAQLCGRCGQSGRACSPAGCLSATCGRSRSPTSSPECGPSCSPACIPMNNCTPTGACAPDHR